MSRALARGLAATVVALALAVVPAAADPAPTLAWKLVAAHPHDPDAFTQGLLMHRGKLLESTGLRRRSQLRLVEPETGVVLRRVHLPRSVFGEGLALAEHRLYQLTWKSGRGFIYHLEDFARVGEFRYPGEGWGLTYDGEHLIMSDGSAELRFIRPSGFREIGRVAVHDDGRPVTRLNELEYVEGAVFANVWTTDRIARIDPGTGRVTGWLDLSRLAGPMKGPKTDVLNGIAWDPDTRRFWITGKRWPRMFVIEVGSS